MNERNAQLQKQLDNVVREGESCSSTSSCEQNRWDTAFTANGELSLMNAKVQGLEKELEQERRRLRDMQESARERDKEYQKLKVRQLQPPCTPHSTLTPLCPFIEPLRQDQAQSSPCTQRTRERACVRCAGGRGLSRREWCSSDGLGC